MAGWSPLSNWLIAQGWKTSRRGIRRGGAAGIVILGGAISPISKEQHRINESAER